MISRNSAFYDLTKKENLEKINIDPKLIPSFISVMQKMQNYFSRKGLIYANNYALLFEKFLLTDDVNNKFSIKFSRFNSTDYGAYSNHERKIFINQFIDEEKIEMVLCHEFIHFLMLTDKPFIENSKGEFEQKSFRFYKANNQYGTFMSEAITEYINKKIYPNSNLYYYHVKMLDYLQKILGNENNMVEYLRSYIPFDYYEKFQEINIFLNDFQNINDSAITYEKVSKNENFMKAQSKAVSLFNEIITKEIESGKFHSIIDYVKRVYQLQDAEPIKSFELKHAIKNANLTYLKKGLNLDIGKEQYKQLYLSKLENIILNYNKLQNDIIIQCEIPYANGKFDLQIKSQQFSLVFDNITKTFDRNEVFSNKYMSFMSFDNDGKEYKNEIMLDIFENKIEVKLLEPTYQEYDFYFDSKKLKYIKNNQIKDMKNDVDFLQSQKKLQQEKSQVCNSKNVLEFQL